MAMQTKNRTITFRGAGDHDVSEVTINAGEQAVEPGSVDARISYTISYRTPGTKLADPEMEKEVAESISDIIRKKLDE